MHNIGMTYDQRSSDDVRAWSLDRPTWRERLGTAGLWILKVVVVAAAIILIAWNSLW